MNNATLETWAFESVQIVTDKVGCRVEIVQRTNQQKSLGVRTATPARLVVVNR